MDSMFNTPQEVVQANMNGAVKKATTSKKKVFFMGIMAGVCIAVMLPCMILQMSVLHVWLPAASSRSV